MAPQIDYDARTFKVQSACAVSPMISISFICASSEKHCFNTRQRKHNLAILADMRNLAFHAGKDALFHPHAHPFGDSWVRLKQVSVGQRCLDPFDLYARDEARGSFP